jgi:3-methyladenine DNA glycosylase Tag
MMMIRFWVLILETFQAGLSWLLFLRKRKILERLFTILITRRLPTITKQDKIDSLFKMRVLFEINKSSYRF